MAARRDNVISITLITQSSSRGWMDPVPDLIHILKFVEVPGIEPATSWSVVRHADH